MAILGDSSRSRGDCPGQDDLHRALLKEVPDIGALCSDANAAENQPEGHSVVDQART
jgi:hypothetical protein